jgi:quinol monooxygenase YgiN
MISVIATIQVKSGSRAEFLKHFIANVEAVRAEVGCIEYFPAVDVATEIEIQTTDANDVVVIEKWESVAALKDHLATPHMIAYRDVVQDLVESVSLRVLSEATQ